MSLSKRANLARGRWARVQRIIDWVLWVVPLAIIAAMLGRLLGMW